MSIPKFLKLEICSKFNEEGSTILYSIFISTFSQTDKSTG